MSDTPEYLRPLVVETARTWPKLCGPRDLLGHLDKFAAEIERAAVERFLLRRIEYYEAIMVANPYASGNDGAHDEAEQKRDVMSNELANLRAGDPCPKCDAPVGEPHR